MDFELIVLELEEYIENALVHFKNKSLKVSVGRANPKVLDNVSLDYYGEKTPLNQVAIISVPDPNQLLIKPFDIKMSKDIVSAINVCNFGFTAVDEGDKVRITIPQLTTERRRQLVREVSTYEEESKIEVRQARQKANKHIKAFENISEDLEKEYLDTIQETVDKAIEKINSLFKEKEKDLLKI